MQKAHRIAGRQSQLRTGRVSEGWACYSVTKVFFGREPRGRQASSFSIIRASLNYLREADRIKLFAFCLMPDHFHVAFGLMPGESLSNVVASFSKHTAAQINRSECRNGAVWQNGFHDRHCRDARELSNLCEYIEHNPVRAGLVKSADAWVPSSAHPDNRCLVDRQWWP